MSVLPRKSTTCVMSVTKASMASDPHRFNHPVAHAHRFSDPVLRIHGQNIAVDVDLVMRRAWGA